MPGSNPSGTQPPPVSVNQGNTIVPFIVAVQVVRIGGRGVLVLSFALVLLRLIFFFFLGLLVF
ncbi:hypothetical protein N657DRAFT_643513 [Parathielavia appendiculata]|uniref:Transmembrane protein n=1 Tax=Parathielavia appendiculata TaxID=2587402 RepID=A0AAN6Z4K7_9PEZI|nr:hypothetical protein N657DRAFT_643513 [Parathielavia appendiculata]